jgi:hypothetical protein
MNCPTCSGIGELLIAKMADPSRVRDRAAASTRRTRDHCRSVTHLLRGGLRQAEPEEDRSRGRTSHCCGRVELTGAV